MEVKKFDRRANFYTLDEFKKINPDFIILNSKFIGRFTYGEGAKTYPKIANFFENLLDEKYPYKKIFDKQTSKVPYYIYPQKIHMLANRVIVFRSKK